MAIERPSRAKAYFDMIKSPDNGAKFLNQLVGSENPTYESEFLEFKGAQDLALNGEDLKALWSLWAKSLSCFANSDGGVLVFGINAPKGEAKSLSLVQDVFRLQELLKTSLPRITEPPVQGVEIEVFSDSNSAKGFVVCFIPSSPWRPHQARLEGQPDQFYIRAADNCVPCSVSMLRALFAPQYVSRFEVCYHLVIRPIHQVHHYQEIFLHCRLDNAGPATASEIFVLCESPNEIGDPKFDHRLWQETVSGRPGRAFVSTRSIHPLERINLFDFELGSISKEGLKRLRTNSILFKFSISARNQLPVKYEIVVQEQDIEDASLKKAILIEDKN